MAEHQLKHVNYLISNYKYLNSVKYEIIKAKDIKEYDSAKLFKIIKNIFKTNTDNRGNIEIAFNYVQESTRMQIIDLIISDLDKEINKIKEELIELGIEL